MDCAPDGGTRGARTLLAALLLFTAAARADIVVPTAEVVGALDQLGGLYLQIPRFEAYSSWAERSIRAGRRPRAAGSDRGESVMRRARVRSEPRLRLDAVFGQPVADTGISGDAGLPAPSGGTGSGQEATVEEILAAAGLPLVGPSAVDSNMDVPLVAIALADYLLAFSDGTIELAFNLQLLLSKGISLDLTGFLLGARKAEGAKGSGGALGRPRGGPAAGGKEGEGSLISAKTVVRSAFKIALGILIGFILWSLLRRF